MRVRERFAVSVILVEHDMRLIMNVCERITVLSYGKVIARGTPAEIRQNTGAFRLRAAPSYGCNKIYLLFCACLKKSRACSWSSRLKVNSRIELW